MHLYLESQVHVAALMPVEKDVLQLDNLLLEKQNKPY